MEKKKKIEFLMNTEWMFEKPIDQEHKEYKLLSYFQKMGEKLDNMELYPGFIELSLHVANLQNLIRDKKIVQSWHASDWPNSHFSKVTFEFTKTKEGTQRHIVRQSLGFNSTYFFRGRYSF
jgi:hypothetical protein